MATSGRGEISSPGSIQLVSELQNSNTLQPYHQLGIEASVREIQHHYKIVETTLVESNLNEVEPAMHAKVLIHHTAAMRTKRAILAYLFHRCRLLSQIRWEHGSVLPENIKEFSSFEEQNFFEGYDHLVSDYSAIFGIDITADLQMPPKDLYIQVRVLEPIGEIMTDSGPVQLEVNSTHYLWRADVEHLIRKGYLEHIP